VFSFEHYFGTKYLAKVNEALQPVSPNKEIPNKTTVSRVMAKCRETKSVCNRYHVNCVAGLTHNTVSTLVNDQLDAQLL
jgi:hypothetical protein